MRIPRRVLAAGMLAAIAFVFTLVTVAAVVLAAEANGSQRLALALLSVAGAMVMLASLVVLAVVPQLRRLWIRQLKSAGRVERIARRVDELPSRRVVRGVDEKAAAAIERVALLEEAVRQLEQAVRGLPNTARLHKLLDVTSKTSASAAVAAVERESSATQRAVRKTLSEIEAVRRDVIVRSNRVERTVPEQSRFVYGQVDGLAALYLTLKPDRAFPPLFSDWAIGADFAAHLVRHVLREHPSNIVELGSGVSTVLLAMAARDAGTGHVWAIEHDSVYADKTSKLLRAHGVERWVTLDLAPLVTTIIGDREFRWYDLTDATLPDSVDLLLVDGPPGGTGPQARFPAVPVLRDRLSERCTVFLDDARREDESEVYERWCAEYGMEMADKVKFMAGVAELRPTGSPPAREVSRSDALS